MATTLRCFCLPLIAFLAACTLSHEASIELPPADLPAEPLRSEAQAEIAGCWHVVAEDESLRSIARRYYGSGRLWRSIQVANDVGQHPVSGSRLWIPGYLPRLD